MTMHNDEQAMREKIMELLTVRGLSQRDLAKMSGVHEVTVSCMVNGTRRVGAGSLLKMLRALDARVKVTGGRG